MTLKEFMAVEEQLAAEDPLNTSVRTDITEIVDLQGSSAIRQEENARVDWGRLPKNQNFMNSVAISEATIKDIKVD